MSKRLGREPHAFLRVSHALHQAGRGTLYSFLTEEVEAGRTLQQIRLKLLDLLPDTPIPSRITLWKYYQRVKETTDAPVSNHPVRPGTRA